MDQVCINVNNSTFYPKHMRMIGTFLPLRMIGTFLDHMVTIVTCSEERDHLGYFIKIEFVCAESNDANFMKNIDHKLSYDQFYTRR